MAAHPPYIITSFVNSVITYAWVGIKFKNSYFYQIIYPPKMNIWYVTISIDFIWEQVGFVFSAISLTGISITPQNLGSHNYFQFLFLYKIKLTSLLVSLWEIKKHWVLNSIYLSSV